MQVVSLAPVPVASLPWRIGDGPWSLSVICKLTLVLEPGEAVIAKRHDPIYEHDRFPDDDSGQSLYAPSDLVPSRPLCDVSVVGSAYAPRGGPVTSLQARLHVLSIDKKLEISAAAKGDGFKSAPLGYEYAAPSETNPLGVESDAKNGGHRIALRSAVDHNPSHTSPGLGPIASHWPSRRRLLSGDEPLVDDMGRPLELPEGFDMGFFNTAPPDQQLHELPPNSDLLLENLHPDHALLRTRLPNVAPQVFVERSDGEKRREIDATISGLWIDTRRSVATLTFHCQVPIDAPDEPGKVWVAVAGPGRRLTASQLGKLIGSLRSSSDGELDDDDTEGDEVLNRTVSIRAKDGKIRRPAREREDTQTSVLSGDARREALATQRDADAARRREDTDSHVAKHHDGLPEWVARGQKSAPPPPPTRARRAARVLGEAYAQDPKPRLAPARAAAMTVPGLGPIGGPMGGPMGDLRPPWPGSGLADTSSLPSHAVHAAAPISGAAGPPSSGGSVASTGPNSQAVSAARMEPPASVAIMPHVAPATNVAATSAVPNHVPPKHAPTEVVELLWFDEEASGRLRRRYSRLADELEFAERDARHDLDRDDPRGRDHHLHFGMLTALAVQDTSGMRLALREAVSETGRFTPPLVVLRGKLRFPFEPLEILRATAAVVTPVAGDDKKLKSALDQVKELLETPLLSGSAETVTNFVSHLRKLYRESRRALSIDYLDETVDRTLLEQRKYDKRTLFGGNWIRALLSLDERDKGVPIYLPEELDKSLPMMTSFNARLIAEAHVRQDQFETHPHALKVVTLGRIVDFNDP